MDCWSCDCYAECDIRFHVKCGSSVSLSLSMVNKHHYHHSLFLTGNNLEDYGDDDSVDLLYCDTCKSERILRPGHTFYCCSECDCNAHVCCVVPEVLLAEELREKRIHFSHDHFLTLLKYERTNEYVDDFLFFAMVARKLCYSAAGSSVWLRSLQNLPSQILYGVAWRNSTSLPPPPSCHSPKTLFFRICFGLPRLQAKLVINIAMASFTVVRNATSISVSHALHYDLQYNMKVMTIFLLFLRNYISYQNGQPAILPLVMPLFCVV